MPVVLSHDAWLSPTHGHNLDLRDHVQTLQRVANNVFVAQIKSHLLLRVVSPAIAQCDPAEIREKFFQIRFCVTAGFLHELPAISLEEAGGEMFHPPDFLHISSYHSTTWGRKTHTDLNVVLQYPMPNSMANIGTDWIKDGDLARASFCKVRREGEINIQTQNGKHIHTFRVRFESESLSPEGIGQRYPWNQRFR